MILRLRLWRRTKRRRRLDGDQESIIGEAVRRFSRRGGRGVDRVTPGANLTAGPASSPAASVHRRPAGSPLGGPACVGCGGTALVTGAQSGVSASWEVSKEPKVELVAQWCHHQ